MAETSSTEARGSPCGSKNRALSTWPSAVLTSWVIICRLLYVRRGHRLLPPQVQRFVPAHPGAGEQLAGCPGIAAIAALFVHLEQAVECPAVVGRADQAGAQ